MPERPDYVALTRGQLAVLDRIDSGQTGLPVLNQIVRLAQDVLGATGAGFAEYSPDHGRVLAASGVCARAVGRRVGRDREDGRHGVLIPLNWLNDEIARQVDAGDGYRML